jgi:hypothetical protein
MLGVGVLTLLRGEPAAEPSGLLSPPPTGFSPVPALTEAELARLFSDDAYLAEFTREHGPEAAVNSLSELQEHTGQDCHYRAHDVGLIAFELLGADALARVGHICQAGAMHSVVERVLGESGTDDLASDVESWCRNAQRAFFRHNCVHGIGHGLLVWVGYELTEALTLCDRLALEEDRYSCWGGVFMENHREGLAGGMAAEHRLHFLRQDDPHYPCNALEEKYLPACYFYQTSQMYVVFGSDFAAVSRECGTLSETLQSWCFRSLGRDVGHHLRDDPEQAIEVCGRAAELSNRLDCLGEVVQHRFWETFGTDWVLDFCGRLAGSDEAIRCYGTIAGRATDLYETPAEFRDFCGRFESAYLWLCDFSLYQQLPAFAEQGRGDWIEATPAAFRQFRERCGAELSTEECDLGLYYQLEQLHQAGRTEQLQ